MKMYLAVFPLLGALALASCKSTDGASPTAPALATFNATPSTVTIGVPTGVTWSWTYSTAPVPAATCTITPGIGGIASGGSATVTLDATTTYTLTCTSVAGTATRQTTISALAPPQAGSPAALHAAASSACEALPLRTRSCPPGNTCVPTSGTVHYFCECSTGAEQHCTEGDDEHDGLTPETAKRTWGAAIAVFNAMNAGDTIALCKGGLWNVPAGSSAVDAGCGYAPHLPQIENPRCGAGTSLTAPENPSTCDIRDYQASWGGTARPVLYAFQSNPTYLIVHGNVHTTNGVRILNLELRGQSQGPGTVGVDHRGLYTSSCAASTQRDWLVCNNDFNHLFLGYQGGDYDTQATTHGAQSGWVIWGNRFTFNELDAILGSIGEHGRIDANFLDNNGCWDPPYTAYAHAIYLSDPNPTQTGYGWVRGVQVVNNEIRYSTGTPAKPSCGSAPLVGHQHYEGLLIENNIVDGGPTAEGHAWGIGMSAAGSGPTSYKDIVVRRNWVRAGGTGISIGSAPGAIIEDNVVIAGINTDGSGWGTGIDVPTEAARPQDTRSTGITIRNNTVYLGSGIHGTRTGILMRQEGSGHVIANNAVYATSGQCWRTLMGHCSITTARECTPDANFYDTGNGLAGCPSGETCLEDDDRWSFIGSNSCFGGASYDDAPLAQSTVTSDPRFTDAPIDFTPSAGSPLIGRGDPDHASAVDFDLTARPSHPSIGAFEP